MSCNAAIVCNDRRMVAIVKRLPRVADTVGDKEARPSANDMASANRKSSDGRLG